MTEETESLIERLKKASAGGTSAAKPQAASTTQPASGSKPSVASSEEEKIRRKAYEKAMGNTVLTKEGVASVTGQLKDNFNLLAQTAATLAAGSVWTYKHVMRPVGRGLTWIPRHLIQAAGGPKNIAKAVNRWTHPEDDQGKRHLSVNRAGAAVIGLVATFGLAVAGVVEAPHIAGATIEDVAVSTATGLWYVTTHKDIKIVMNTSQMDNAVSRRGMLEGCTSLPCTENNSWHFVVDDTGFHHLHSLLTGNGFFNPHRIVAPVANTYNLCEVDAYGSLSTFYDLGLMDPRAIGVKTCYPMETKFDPSYISYINTILHSKESLTDAILHTPAPASAGSAIMAPIVAPAPLHAPQ